MALAISTSREEQDRALAYAVFRLAFGVNIFGHGFVRLLNGAGKFAEVMVETMSQTILPAAIVRPFGYTLSYAEFAIGLLLIIGLFTRPTLIAGGLLMAALTWGTTLRQDWGNAGVQVSYSVAYFLLLYFLRYNQWSVDRLLKRS